MHIPNFTFIYNILYNSYYRWILWMNNISILLMKLSMDYQNCNYNFYRTYL